MKIGRNNRQGDTRDCEESPPLLCNNRRMLWKPKRRYALFLLLGALVRRSYFIPTLVDVDTPVDTPTGKVTAKTRETPHSRSTNSTSSISRPLSVHSTIPSANATVPVAIIDRNSSRTMPAPNSNNSSSNNNNNSNSTERLFVRVQKGDQIMKRGTMNAPIVIEKYKLIFFPIQKVGGTVWKQLFKRMLGRRNWYKGQSLGGPDKSSGLHSLYQYSLQDATEMMNDPNWTKAIMVRDPKERFLSAYLDKGFNSKYFYQKCCSKKKKKHNHHRCGNGTKHHFSFETFIDVTSSCRNSHWDPQSHRVQSKYLPLLTFVGHLETAYDDAKELLTRVGGWERFGANGWGVGKNESIFQSTSNVRHKTAESSSSSRSRLAHYYTPDLERQIEKRMQSDYNVPQFGLPMTKIKY